MLIEAFQEYFADVVVIAIQDKVKIDPDLADIVKQRGFQGKVEGDVLTPYLPDANFVLVAQTPKQVAS